MRKSFIPVIFAITISLLLLQPAHAQNYEYRAPGLISVQSVSSRLVGINYSPSPSMTNIYPPSNHDVPDGWQYEIDLTIQLTGEDLAWKTPFGLTLIFPDGSRQNKILNNEAKPLYPNNLYKFKFNVVCRRKGWTMIKMYPLEEWDKQNIFNVDFKTSEVCLE